MVYSGMDNSFVESGAAPLSLLKRVCDGPEEVD